MPATNPRLTITLEPTLAAQLRRLSELTGNSQSKLIAEILEGSTEVFDRLIKVLEAAELAKDQLKGKATEDMKHAQQRMEAQFGLLFDDFDRGTASILEAVEKVPRRAARGASLRRASGGSAGVPTPMSNRGVRSLATKKKKVDSEGRK